MTVYNTIRGLKVKYLSSDPANPEVGQVWYNSTTSNLRVDGILGTGAWSSGGAMNTARQALAGAGTKDDMIVAGGTPPTVAAAETYNGTSWANITDFPSVLEQAGSTGATTSAANIVGGNPGAKTSTQHWNGSGWTAGGSLSQGRANFQGSGPHTAGIVLCGQGTPSNTNCEKYNGTSWTAAGSLPTAVQVFGSTVAGTSGAAIGSGGYYDLRPSGTEAQTALTWSYDGSSWSTVNSMNSTRYQGMGGGTQGSAYVAGYPTSPRGTTTEQWDGTSWTTGAAMAAARAVGASAAASGANATVAGGNNTAGARLATSEEFTTPVGTQSITTS